VNEKSLNRKTGKPGRKNPTGRLDRWLAIEPHSHHFFQEAGLRSRRNYL
jgi:hypothetical protein